MAGVDGVAAVAYGTPESAAAILAASESVSGVRGGLGGGGAGAASLAVGEQLQNMVGGPGGWGRGGGAAPSDGSRTAERCAARAVSIRNRSAGPVVRPDPAWKACCFEMLVCYMPLAASAARPREIGPELLRARLRAVVDTFESHLVETKCVTARDRLSEPIPLQRHLDSQHTVAAASRHPAG